MAGTRLLLVAALDARLLQQLAVLLLSHALAALLDNRAHGTTLLGLADDGHANTLARSGRQDTHPCMRLPLMRRASAADHGHRLCRPRDQPREQPRRETRRASPQGPGPAARCLLSSRGTDVGS